MDRTDILEFKGKKVKFYLNGGIKLSGKLIEVREKICVLDERDGKCKITNELILAIGLVD